jgi:hypothetical protein
MIKPGTFCMIRGAPQHQAECNGKIVQVTGVNAVPSQNSGETVYNFEPVLYINHKGFVIEIYASVSRYLHPLQDFDADELNNTDRQLETV